MSDELPKGWAFPQLEELFDFVIGGDWGKPPETDEADFTNAYCIRGTEFRHWDKERGKTRVLRKVKFSSLEKRALEKGDILIEISGGGPNQPVGRTVLIDTKSLSVKPNFPSVCTNFIRLAKPSAKLDSAYLNYYLKTFYLSGEITKYQGGSNNLRNLKFKEYCTIPIPFAPLNEQIRIANELDSLLAKVDAAQTRLEKIPTLLKRFRQSILAAATSGELTKEWRKDATFGEVVNVGSLISDIRYGTSKKCNYERGGTGVLRIPNIGGNGIDASDLKYANFNTSEKEKLGLKKGDLLVIRSNGSVDLVGKADIVTDRDLDYLFAGYLIRLRFRDLSVVDPKYVLFSLQSPAIRSVVEINARSTSGINNINSKELAALEISLPSYKEQKEVVRRVEFLFALANSVEKQYTEAKKHTDRLTQSLLAKAFRGELVPQDPNDEPASELLKRIQAEREALKPAMKTRPKKA